MRAVSIASSLEHLKLLMEAEEVGG